MTLSRRSFVAATAAAGLGITNQLVASPVSHVLVVPSLHKRLRNNPHFSYDDLYAVVYAFKPEQVGVEIRQEDLNMPERYLRKNYPREMVDLTQVYGNQCFGFDWLGYDLAGRPIPDDWWTKFSHIKQLERDMSTAALDASPKGKGLSDRINALAMEQDRIAATASVAELASGNYDDVTKQYYAAIKKLTADTPYAELSNWYTTRDSYIASNIVAQVNLHGKTRIAVITGADHHGPVVAALNSNPGIVLDSVANFSKRTSFGSRS